MSPIIYFGNFGLLSLDVYLTNNFENLPEFFESRLENINNVTATEYLEMGLSGQRNQKGEIDIELSD
jgi:hypothetical protein